MGIDSHTPTWWLEWAPELSAKASEVWEQAPGGRRGKGSHAKTRRREKVGDGPSAAVTQGVLWP
jgi:hypothetical protein